MSAVRCRERGQAMVEAVLGLAAIGVLFWAIPLLGRHQDVALESATSSRHAAFLMTREAFDTDALHALAVAPAFTDADRRWRDASGAAMLAGPPGVGVRRVASSPAMQPGGFDAAAGRLREDWRLDDPGALLVRVEAPVRSLAGLGIGHGLVLGRETAILTGAGHAVHDADAHDRIAAGRAGWGEAASASRAAGVLVRERMRAVDAGWGRPLPEFGWLDRWQGLVPDDVLVEAR